ncbi:acetyl/propionyl/methylcrotonyl-CoA carboxylase subunit alpha [Marimonas lutisalis]|uniref:acetyl/propionyl/methylcrotonyl-CoA carboxylase subunit alpha n=1 Tax=Marimonas lutisalis TaxID=2545756 RepID=UPI0010F92214|nr:acetyl-CoA carboxylase biotin carboxylase subunit [Marimonas lutisalis]
MFDTLLVANRGEIACRIIRTARGLGLITVAVHSTADADAPHVALADQAVCIGPASAGESYLNASAILHAARATGAQAIHPGYGFLSENADFARAVAAAGLTFIGPSPDAIEIMGDKARAKQAVQAAGVPCVPGYDGDDQSDEALIAQGQAIGFPVMVKAAAGGGGRGMRLVRDAADLPAALARARDEAQNAFGSDKLILERAIQNARHVEIQVFADSHGTMLHLGERDCSVQRRHQKVLEEAPCPALTPEMRAAMGAVAVEAARAVNYLGAGTVEFLLDEDGRFYFLEMNTRLQVEHPVTELVTGLDLVALQIAVAQGDPLPLSQGDVTLSGHAIEARLYAEDPANGFLPATGTVALWAPPAGDGIRTDAGIAKGQDIGPYYDPMLAKIIAHGPDRATALSRLRAALADTACLGLTTNAGFLSAILDTPTFAEGRATTGFLDTEFPDGLRATPPASDILALAAALLLRSEMQTAHAVSSLPDDTLLGFASDGGLPIPLDLSAGDTTHALQARCHGPDHWTVTGEQPHEITVLSSDAGRLTVLIDGTRHRAFTAPDGTGGLYLQLGTATLHAARHCPWASDGAEAHPGQITAPMPGRVVSVEAALGSTVAKGQTIAVLEAMKMQHQLTAGADGTLAELHVAPGDQLTTGALIARIAEDT